jgi:hypothetical protein
MRARCIQNFICAAIFAGRKQRFHTVLRYPDSASDADGGNPKFQVRRSQVPTEPIVQTSKDIGRRLNPGLQRAEGMKEYVFEVKLVAVVRVNAQNESLARKVVLCSALGSPSPDEIRLANETHGGGATITAVDFFPEKESVRLIRDNEDNDST